ncbi:hypothetical protein [Anaeromicropila populeti]|nr:hypothetical protein [Anaeromicropila populeti]
MNKFKNPALQKKKSDNSVIYSNEKRNPFVKLNQPNVFQGAA